MTSRHDHRLNMNSTHKHMVPQNVAAESSSSGVNLTLRKLNVEVIFFICLKKINKNKTCLLGKLWAESPVLSLCLFKDLKPARNWN